jgi:hypothetical protein
MHVRVHSAVGSGLLVLGLAAVVGCGRPSPVSPTAAATPASPAGIAPSNGIAAVGAVRPSGNPGETFPLVGGTFDIGNGTDGISGTYSGTALSSSGSDRASLTLQITGGTGVYAGASGTLSASGTGAFTGEGAFSLDVRGDATLAGGRRVHVSINLSGTSSVSCSALDQILVTQTGAGSMGRAGRVSAPLQHEVEQTGCMS